MSEFILKKELDKEQVYFVQLRTNYQITIPRECVKSLGLEIGDIIAIAVLKLVDKDTTWSSLQDKLKKLKGGD